MTAINCLTDKFDPSASGGAQNEKTHINPPPRNRS
jgi:hypothetical protein